MDAPAMLLVDPDVWGRQELIPTFEEAGYQVTVAGDDGQALAAMLRAWPDVVVMAESAWESRGIELVGYMWQAGYTPLVILGESRDSADGVPYLEAGADVYLTWPVDMRELLVRVGNLVHRTRELRKDLRNVN